MAVVTQRTPSWRVIGAWALYDFANTIFSMNVVSRYFALWLREDLGGVDLHYSLAYAASITLTLVTMPLLGVLSDVYERRMPFLIACTVVSVAGTAMLGRQTHFFAAMAWFAVANYAYQMSLVVYNALLPLVAGTSRSVGKVSGYGVALGYAGAIGGLLLVQPFVARGGNVAAFLPTAVLFLLFSLPCLLVVRDPRVSRPEQKPRWKHLPAQVIQAAPQLFRSIRDARAHRALFLFLLANLVYCDAINTVILFMSVYAKRVIGFGNRELDAFLITATVCAIGGSYLWGLVTSRWGAGRTLFWVLMAWVVALTLALVSFSPRLFWLVGPMAGIGLGGVWVTGRTLVVELSPPAQLGEFFGLYGLTEKFTAILGPLLWGVTVFLFERWGHGLAGYRIAIGELLAAILAGWWILHKAGVSRWAA
ncbi:MAG: MFS transporter [Elusimicrobia bacterium]|nr:MFS transporter [Elusimicrobiota bacterium]